MPTMFTHAAIAIIGGKICVSRRIPSNFWFWSIACSALPDIDVLAFSIGIPYTDMLGHRGLTHSLPFALILAFFVVWAGFPDIRLSSLRGLKYFLYFTALTASHGVLDAMTKGGEGVAFLAPFSTERFFLPWRPLEVSPIGMRFISERGLDVFLNELIWIWSPLLLTFILTTLYRRTLPKKTHSVSQKNKSFF